MHASRNGYIKLNRWLGLKLTVSGRRSNSKGKEFLKELQEKYVFVSANIIIVICKHYYLKVICKELSFWPSTESGDTYIAEVRDLNEIIGNRISYVKCLGFKEDNLSDKLPSFYRTPVQSFTNHHICIV